MVSKAAIVFSDDVADDCQSALPVGEEDSPPTYLNIIVQPKRKKKVPKNCQVYENCIFCVQTLEWAFPPKKAFWNIFSHPNFVQSDLDTFRNGF